MTTHYLDTTNQQLNSNVSEVVSVEGEVVTSFLSGCHHKAQTPLPTIDVTLSTNDTPLPPQDSGEEVEPRQPPLLDQSGGGGANNNTNRSSGICSGRHVVTRNMLSPSSDRRVIFPSLHPGNSRSVAPWPQQGLVSKISGESPVDVQHASPEASSGSMSSKGNTRSATGKHDLSSSADFFVSEGGSQSRRLILPTPMTHSCEKPLCSILRSSGRFKNRVSSESTRPATVAVDKIPSVESDIPSLASTMSQSSVEEVGSPIRRPIFPRYSVPTTKTNRKISFDPRVWVREFRRTRSEEDITWYCSEDLETFKADAIKLIVESSETQLVPTGTGRFVPRRNFAPEGKVLFSHRALRLDPTEDLNSDERLSSRKNAQEREIRRILIVDPHDICIKLFAKAFKHVFPHVEIVGTVSSDDALERYRAKPFDVVLVEERLKLFHHQDNQFQSNRECINLASGAALIQALKEINDRALFIGVSNRLREDSPKLKAAGAGMCWSKPPPKLDDSMADEILQALLTKRRMGGTIREIFTNCYSVPAE